MLDCRLIWFWIGAQARRLSTPVAFASLGVPQLFARAVSRRVPDGLRRNELKGTGRHKAQNITERLERATGFEPVTSNLEGSRSTTELRPLIRLLDVLLASQDISGCLLRLPRSP